MTLSEAQKIEIEAARDTQVLTRRVVAPDLEAILYSPLPLLDHGFIRVIDYMGNDAAIVQAARVSYGRGTKKAQDDRGLINYLMRHRHTSPFEMCEIKLHVRLPMFVARQWIRHRTANVNEYSARYSIMDNLFYVPDPENLATQATENRQGRARKVTGEEAESILKSMETHATDDYALYEKLLNEGGGNTNDPQLARELARMVLPVSVYTQWYWKIDLHNLFHFLSLRADPHAQFEIKVYADKLFEIANLWVPSAAHAFEEHVMCGARLSRTALKIVQRMLLGETVTQENSGLSKGEWREFEALLLSK